MATTNATAAQSSIISVGPLGFPFKTPNPFLFAVYHLDHYPADKSGKMHAPRRGNGSDFDWSAPFRMYHGERIPGFPQHPHRGFETISIVLGGACDHSDSLGNTGRFGHPNGDLQWVTTGKGIVHGENFPLVNEDKDNTLRFFQIWLNLPRASKMVEPSYVMHWGEKVTAVDGPGGAKCRVFAGRLGDAARGQAPPPASWANDPANDVAVLHVALPPGGSSFVLPPAATAGVPGELNRYAYFVVAPGKGVSVGGRALPGKAAVELDARASTTLANEGTEAAEVLVLQGRPINEPVVQHGPFVMNSQAEIQQTFAEYRATQFGGWPYAEDAVVFPRDAGRFSTTIGKDGKPVTERPPAA